MKTILYLPVVQEQGVNPADGFVFAMPAGATVFGAGFGQDENGADHLIVHALGETTHTQVRQCLYILRAGMDCRFVKHELIGRFIGTFQRPGIDPHHVFLKGGPSAIIMPPGRA